MREYHPKHRALITMDDMSRQLHGVAAMKPASFQCACNWNIPFRAIVKYPFFTRSELSNGVQFADPLACYVYRACELGDFCCPYFERVLPNFNRRRDGESLDGLRVLPEPMSLVGATREAWKVYKQKAVPAEGE